MITLSPWSFVNTTDPASPFLNAFTLDVKSFPFNPSFPVNPFVALDVSPAFPSFPSLPSDFDEMLSNLSVIVLDSFNVTALSDIDTSIPFSPLTVNLSSLRFILELSSVPSFDNVSDTLPTFVFTPDISFLT